MRTAFKLKHRPSGNVLRTPFDGMGLALAFLEMHLPQFADECEAIPVQIPDERDVTDAAERILAAGPSGWSMILDDGFVGCVGCRTGIYEHKIESHAKTCLPLRDLAYEAIVNSLHAPLPSLALAEAPDGR